MSSVETGTVAPAESSDRPVGRSRLPIPSEQTIRGLAIASFVSQIGIIVTGGAVRLTGSGLGCPEWPSCTSESWIATSEMGVHGVIEFGNRMLGAIVGLIAVLTSLAIWRTLRTERPRRDLLVPASILLTGVGIQAVIGGISVRTTLSPWVVMLHFMCSAVLVGVATVLVRRAQRPLGVRPEPLGAPWLARLGLAAMAAAYLAVYLGTVVTGTGPHAGDPDSPRTGFDLATVTQLHVHAVTLLIGLSVGLYIAARAAGSPGRLATAALVLLGVEVAQGVIGVTQYALELPELLVGLHMLLAALLVAAAVDAWLASRWAPQINATSSAA